MRSEITFLSEVIRNPREFHNAGDNCDCWQYLDIDTYVDSFLLGEMLCDTDRGHASSYVYRRHGEKLMFGPYWDGDNSMRGSTDAFMTNAERRDFYRNFVACGTFRAKLEERWRQLRSGIWSNEELFRLFDSMVECMKEPALQYAQRWPKHYDDSTAWENEVNHLRLWLEIRLAWLDDNIPEIINQEPYISFYSER